jgi:hypothetical protein
MASNYASVPQPLPLYVAAHQPERRNRLTAGIRLIMVIPQVIVLFFVAIAGLIVAIIGWFAALVTGHLPTFAEDFLSGVIRWGTRVRGYLHFLTDEYPPFSLDVEVNYPVQIAIPPPSDLNRLAVLFRIIIAIPAFIVASVVSSGIALFSIGSWAVILFTGAMPEPLYEATTAAVRFEARYYGYFFMLAAEYPWGLYGDNDQTRPAPPAQDPTASPGWLLRLTSKGRTALTVLVVLGVLEGVISNVAR